MVTICVSILETRFFRIFQKYLSLLLIMILMFDDHGRHLLLTEKKEQH